MLNLLPNQSIVIIGRVASLWARLPAGRPVWHNFLKGREITLPCSNRSTYSNNCHWQKGDLIETEICTIANAFLNNYVFCHQEGTNITSKKCFDRSKSKEVKLTTFKKKLWRTNRRTWGFIGKLPYQWIRLFYEQQSIKLSIGERIGRLLCDRLIKSE